MRISAFIGSVLLLAATPALSQAKIDFAAYEGTPVIKVGTGGTKITKNGIDYWTTGEPPRRYQVIGAVQDKRDETWDGGHAIGSPSIAKKVRKAGGDAVIVLSENEAGHSGGFSSTTGFASGGFGWLFGMGLSGGSKTITRMVAVKYLPETQAIDGPPQPINAPTSQVAPSPSSAAVSAPTPSQMPLPKPKTERQRVVCVTCRP